MRAYEFVFEHETMLLELSKKKRAEISAKFKRQNYKLSDKNIDLLLDDWEKYGAGRNIDQYSYAQARELMDEAILRQELRGKSKGRFVQDDNIKPIYSENNLEIFLADTKKKCQYLSHRHAGKYNWCIGQAEGYNLFNSYQPRKPVFYFVFDYDKKPDDIWHAVVIIVYPDKIQVATADNPGDKEMTWEKIVANQPKLAGLEDIIVHRNLKAHTIQKFMRYSNDLSFIEKFNYIDNDFLIPDTELKQLYDDEPLLFNLYAKRHPISMTNNNHLFQLLTPGTQKYVKYQLQNLIRDAIKTDDEMFFAKLSFPISIINDDLAKEAYYFLSCCHPNHRHILRNFLKLETPQFIDFINKVLSQDDIHYLAAAAEKYKHSYITLIKKLNELHEQDIPVSSIDKNLAKRIYNLMYDKYNDVPAMLSYIDVERPEIRIFIFKKILPYYVKFVDTIDKYTKNDIENAILYNTNHKTPLSSIDSKLAKQVYTIMPNNKLSYIVKVKSETPEFIEFINSIIGKTNESI